MTTTKIETTKTPQNMPSSHALFEAMCALEEKQAKVSRGIETCRANHKLGATPGEDYRLALETFSRLGDAHDEIDRLRLEAIAKEDC